MAAWARASPSGLSTRMIAFNSRRDRLMLASSGWARPGVVPVRLGGARSYSGKASVESERHLAGGGLLSSPTSMRPLRLRRTLATDA